MMMMMMITHFSIFRQDLLILVNLLLKLSTLLSIAISSFNHTMQMLDLLPLNTVVCIYVERF